MPQAAPQSTTRRALLSAAPAAATALALAGAVPAIAATTLRDEKTISSREGLRRRWEDFLASYSGVHPRMRRVVADAMALGLAPDQCTTVQLKHPKTELEPLLYFQAMEPGPCVVVTAKGSWEYGRIWR